MSYAEEDDDLGSVVSTTSRGSLKNTSFTPKKSKIVPSNNNSYNSNFDSGDDEDSVATSSSKPKRSNSKIQITKNKKIVPVNTDDYSKEDDEDNSFNRNQHEIELFGAAPFEVDPVGQDEVDPEMGQFELPEAPEEDVNALKSEKRKRKKKRNKGEAEPSRSNQLEMFAKSVIPEFAMIATLISFQDLWPAFKLVLFNRFSCKTGLVFLLVGLFCSFIQSMLENSPQYNVVVIIALMVSREFPNFPVAMRPYMMLTTLTAMSVIVDFFYLLAPSCPASSKVLICITFLTKFHALLDFLYHSSGSSKARKYIFRRVRIFGLAFTFIPYRLLREIRYRILAICCMELAATVTYFILFLVAIQALAFDRIISNPTVGIPLSTFLLFKTFSSFIISVGILVDTDITLFLGTFGLLCCCMKYFRKYMMQRREELGGFPLVYHFNTQRVNFVGIAKAVDCIFGIAGFVTLGSCTGKCFTASPDNLKAFVLCVFFVLLVMDVWGGLLMYYVFYLVKHLKKRRGKFEGGYDAAIEDSDDSELDEMNFRGEDSQQLSAEQKAERRKRLKEKLAKKLKKQKRRKNKELYGAGTLQRSERVAKYKGRMQGDDGDEIRGVEFTDLEKGKGKRGKKYSQEDSDSSDSSDSDLSSSDLSSSGSSESDEDYGNDDDSTASSVVRRRNAAMTASASASATASLLKTPDKKGSGKKKKDRYSPSTTPTSSGKMLADAFATTRRASSGVPSSTLLLSGSKKNAGYQKFEEEDEGSAGERNSDFLNMALGDADETDSAGGATPKALRVSGLDVDSASKAAYGYMDADGYYHSPMQSGKKETPDGQISAGSSLVSSAANTPMKQPTRHEAVERLDLSKLSSQYSKLVAGAAAASASATAVDQGDNSGSDDEGETPSKLGSAVKVRTVAAAVPRRNAPNRQVQGQAFANKPTTASAPTSTVLIHRPSAISTAAAKHRNADDVVDFISSVASPTAAIGGNSFTMGLDYFSQLWGEYSKSGANYNTQQQISLLSTAKSKPSKIEITVVIGHLQARGIFVIAYNNYTGESGAGSATARSVARKNTSLSGNSAMESAKLFGVMRGSRKLPKKATITTDSSRNATPVKPSKREDDEELMYFLLEMVLTFDVATKRTIMDCNFKCKHDAFMDEFIGNLQLNDLFHCSAPGDVSGASASSLEE